MLAAVPFLRLHLFYDDFLQDAVLDAGHLPLFAVVTLFLFWGTPRSWELRARYLFAVLVSTVLALGVELVQPFFNRSLSIGDFVHDSAGIGIAIAGVHVARAGTRPRIRALYVAVCLATLGLASIPIWAAWRPLAWRAEAFPVLADFEEQVELGLWVPRGGSEEQPTTLTLSEEHVSSGARSLEVRLGAGGWPGLRYDAGRADWQPFGTFACDIYNPGETFRLTLRIDDSRPTERREDEFNLKLDVKPGWNRIRLPVEEIRTAPPGRDLDVTRIDRIVIFARKGEPPRTFYLDHVRLEGPQAGGSDGPGGEGSG
jgi:hypothetical protein